MIEVSDAARKELSRLINENAGGDNSSLRLTPSADGLGLTVDAEKPGDYVFEYDGKKVLLVAEDLAPDLVGISMEVEETPEGPALLLRQQGGCSCCGGGESACGGGSCGDGGSCH